MIAVFQCLYPGTGAYFSASVILGSHRMYNITAQFLSFFPIRGCHRFSPPTALPVRQPVRSKLLTNPLFQFRQLRVDSSIHALIASHQRRIRGIDNRIYSQLFQQFFICDVPFDHNNYMIHSQRHILLLCASFWLLRWIFYITRTFNRKFTNTCVNCLITLYVFYM